MNLKADRKVEPDPGFLPSRKCALTPFFLALSINRFYRESLPTRKPEVRAYFFSA